ncbi:MAG: hypothetical protein R2911_21330 [Caldilineaceae bacterium]
MAPLRAAYGNFLFFMAFGRAMMAAPAFAPIQLWQALLAILISFMVGYTEES